MGANIWFWIIYVITLEKADDGSFNVVRPNDERKANARRWGLRHGYEGRSGGNVYNADGRRICQGWWAFFEKYRFVMLADVQAGTFKVSRSKGGA